ncbi:MAG: hypothetical protein Kow0089_00050 [Desulfobulbaceae bacterium]
MRKMVEHMPSLLRKKRFILPLLATLFAGLALALPFLLSTGAALNFFLATLNKRIPGTLTVDSWLVGWQQGILCRNLSYSSPREALTISASSLTTDRGLLELVLAPENLGTLHLAGPRARVSENALRDLFNKGRERSGGSKRSLTSPPWEGIYCDLQAREGELELLLDGGESLRFSDVTLNSTLAKGTVAFDTGFRLMGQGAVDAEGNVNLPAHADNWLETINGEVKLEIRSLALAELPTFGSGSMPEGDGEFTADFTIRTLGGEGISVAGTSELADVSLTGGFFGEDHPSFRKITLEVENGRWTRQGWGADRLRIASDTLDLRGSGSWGVDSLTFQAEAEVRLPVLFDQLPRMLGVNEETLLESGTLDFSLDIGRQGDDFQALIKAKAGEIGGVYQGAPFSWDSPLLLYINGSKEGKSLRLGAFQFESPFGYFNGSGDLGNLAVDGELEVGNALMDAGTLFQAGVSGNGQLVFSLRGGREAGESKRLRFDSELNIENFSLSRDGRVIVPEHECSLVAGLGLPADWLETGTGEVDLQAVLSSWVGEVFFVLNGESLSDNVFSGYFTTDGELNLSGLAPLLQLFDLADAAVQTSGTVQLQAAGFHRDRKVEIRDLFAEIDDFRLEGEKVVFEEPEIRLKTMRKVSDEADFLTLREMVVAERKDSFFQEGGGVNSIDFGSGALFLHDLRLESDTLKLGVNHLLLPDPTTLESLRGDLSLSLDLEKASRGLQILGLLDSTTGLKGASQLSLSLADLQGGDRKLEMAGTVDDFFLTRRGRTIAGPEDVTLSLEVTGQIPLGNMRVGRCRLDGKTLAVDATGAITAVDDEQTLELTGTIRPDLEKLGILVAAETGADVQMSGKGDERFVFRLPLSAAPLKPGDLSFVSSLHPETLTVADVTASGVDIPFQYDKRRLHVETSGSVRGGKLMLVVDGDFTVEQPFFRTPDSMQVLSGVTLDDVLAAALPGRVNPLFGGLAKPSGTLDVRLDSFWYPWGGGAEETRFVLVFDVRDVRLEMKKILRDKLDSFGTGQEELRLRENEIYCIGAKGRIKCSPVRMMAGTTEVVVGGVVNSDRTLDYTVEIDQVGPDDHAGEGPTEFILGGTLDAPVFKGAADADRDGNTAPGAEGDDDWQSISRPLADE